MGYELATSVALSKVCSELGLEFMGPDRSITLVGPSGDSKPGFFCFSKSLEGIHKESIVVTNASVIDGECSVVVTDNPRLTFIKCLDWIFHNIGFNTWDFDAEVDKTAQIHSSAVIERGCVIGKRVIIEANVTIHSGTRIGDGSRVRSNSSIGGDGFGFERLDGSESIRFPHLGGVQIGRNVEIGALNSVACGTLSDTIIEDNVKTDNLVHIAHNCHLRQGVFLTACAELSGGVHIDENVWVGPNSSVMQKVKLGRNSLIGIGSNVIKNVPEDAVFAGNPAKDFSKK